MKRAELVNYFITGIAGSLLAIAILSNNPSLALGILVGLMITLFSYSEWLEREGIVFNDERTLRIDETASRRALQALIIMMSITVVISSFNSRNSQFWKGIYVTSSITLALTAILKIVLRHYYSRIM
ncbi:DUF2178 domain-containing protein [Thermococcus sp.]|uniref:DUF2178 domain-containing protein n=1 Tax=Thermococcus sp. TaxID=35749 RepID=UPI002631F016|nr:DUF2178 domain-containing protein [Thermococcus sp.]